MAARVQDPVVESDHGEEVFQRKLALALAASAAEGHAQRPTGGFNRGAEEEEFQKRLAIALAVSASERQRQEEEEFERRLQAAIQVFVLLGHVCLEGDNTCQLLRLINPQHPF